MDTKNTATAPKSNLSTKINDLKGEYKRIIWPTPAELRKNTVTVIITCAIFGALIFVMDYVYNFGAQLIINAVK